MQLSMRLIAPARPHPHLSSRCSRGKAELCALAAVATDPSSPTKGTPPPPNRRSHCWKAAGWRSDTAGVYTRGLRALLRSTPLCARPESTSQHCRAMVATPLARILGLRATVGQSLAVL